MRMQRKILGAVVVALICLLTHVFVAPDNPNHPDASPPALWFLTLLVGIFIGLIFLGIASFEAWLIRRKSETIKIAADLCWFVAGALASFAYGYALTVI